jgi:PAN domain
MFMEKKTYVTIIIAVITTVTLLLLVVKTKSESQTETFEGSQFNVIAGYFPQAVVSNELKSVSDAGGCLEACDANPQCTGFFQNGVKCWNITQKSDTIPALIKTANPKDFMPITGIKQTSKCEPTQQLLGGKCSGNDYPGNDLLVAPYFVQADTMANCVEKCLDNNKCMGVSYNTVKKACYLKSKMKGGGNPAKYMISWISPYNT